VQAHEVAEEYWEVTFSLVALSLYGVLVAISRHPETVYDMLLLGPGLPVAEGVLLGNYLRIKQKVAFLGRQYAKHSEEVTDVLALSINVALLGLGFMCLIAFMYAKFVYRGVQCPWIQVAGLTILGEKLFEWFQKLWRQVRSEAIRRRLLLIQLLVAGKLKASNGAAFGYA
jgi:hypothetical protein